LNKVNDKFINILAPFKTKSAILYSPPGDEKEGEKRVAVRAKSQMRFLLDGGAKRNNLDEQLDRKNKKRN